MTHFLMTPLPNELGGGANLLGCNYRKDPTKVNESLTIIVIGVQPGPVDTRGDQTL